MTNVKQVYVVSSLEKIKLRPIINAKLSLLTLVSPCFSDPFPKKLSYRYKFLVNCSKTKPYSYLIIIIYSSFSRVAQETKTNQNTFFKFLKIYCRLQAKTFI